MHLLQDGVIIGPRGPEVQPAITIIGCTTDVGRLPETIIDRFPVRPTIVNYTDVEGAGIAMHTAGKLFGRASLKVPSDENFTTVALVSGNNPRTMRSILITARDIAVVEGVNVVRNPTRDTDYLGGRYDFSLASEWLGLTTDGLTVTCQRYLIALSTEFAGEPAGEAAKKDRLQEPGGLRSAETLLAHKGFIFSTKRGGP